MPMSSLWKSRQILFVVLIASFGYPSDRPLTPVEEPKRRPFGDVVHRGHW
jgi:hypothetical protein